MSRMLVVKRMACAGVLFVLALPAQSQDKEEMKKDEKPTAGVNPRVALEIESGGRAWGKIVLELDAEKAPITVDNFLQYCGDGFYNGLIFHRVIPTFMIQAGGYTPDVVEKKEGLRPGIKNEWRNGLKNSRGTISMARVGGQPDSGSAQFFINVVDNARLDQPQQDGAAYAVFGKVVEGMDVVDKVRDAKCIQHPNYPAGAVTPETPVIIKSATILDGYDRAKLSEKVKSMTSAAKEAEVSGKAELAKRFEADRAKATTSQTGLMYVTQREGTGPQPTGTERVEVHYTGWLLDGTEFDSSVRRGQPFQFSLKGGVIEGWLEGVKTMKVGEKRTLIIPPELGYGTRGAGNVIPPNATLVFDVELLGIK